MLGKVKIDVDPATTLLDYDLFLRNCRKERQFKRQYVPGGHMAPLGGIGLVFLAIKQCPGCFVRPNSSTSSTRLRHR